MLRVVVNQQSVNKTAGNRAAQLAPRRQSAFQPQNPQLDIGVLAFNFSRVPLFAHGEDPGNRGLTGARPALLPWPMQAKLEIGGVNDPLENEADRVADGVLRMPDPGLLSFVGGDIVQRKCSACAEEEKQQTVRRKCQSCSDEEQKKKKDEETHEKLSRKESGGATALDGTAAPAIVLDVLRSPGEPLDKSTREFFESRFGSDFSGVRLHTDTRASQSARHVNALAYTVGRHVVFASGQHAPHTTSGRRLLAHELSHVIQQAHGGGPQTGVPLTSGVLRRIPPPKPTPLPAIVPPPGPGDFEITSVRPSSTSEIFFQKNSSTLTADASTQIASLKSAAPGGVRLLCFSSADETATVAADRCTRVKIALTTPPNPVAVSSTSASATAQVGQSDFPSVRKVEIVVGAAPPSTLNCALRDAAGNLVNPPKQPCSTMDTPTKTAFNTALTIANDAMTRATAAVAGAPSATNAPVIDQFFGNHNASTLTTLRTNLGKLQTHVSGLPGITSCGGQCDSGGCDTGSTIAYNQGVDAASTMTVCVPRFKSLSSDNDRARNLIHESAHGTSPLGGPARPTEGTKDVAYRHERMLFQLSTADRLRNSDSYALFALTLRERQISGSSTAVPAGISTPAADNITGFPPGEVGPMKLALAKLEKRLTWATDWMAQLYGQIVKIHDGSQTWAASWAEELMREVAKRFPVGAPAPPPALPSLDDQTREAGILERYRRMHAAVKRDLNISHMAAGVVTWAAGGPGSQIASDSLEVGSELFMATPENQISILLEELAKVTPGVEPAFIPAYVSLAAWIHSKNP